MRFLYRYQLEKSGKITNAKLHIILIGVTYKVPAILQPNHGQCETGLRFLSAQNWHNYYLPYVVHVIICVLNVSSFWWARPRVAFPFVSWILLNPVVLDLSDGAFFQFISLVLTVLGILFFILSENENILLEIIRIFPGFDHENKRNILNFLPVFGSRPRGT